tara:strand:+ start:492 stop:1130 length:639 start_codon:yes stop_codon:yes gene_type:complete
MTSTLALIEEKNPQEPDESDREYEDRMLEKAFWKLNGKKKLTKKEEKEYEELTERYGALCILRDGKMPEVFADQEVQSIAARLRTELVDEFGGDSPSKRILIDRLVFAWNMSLGYEQLFRVLKYKKEADGTISIRHDDVKTRMLRETRSGLESSNDQIIRLTQALRDLTTPPLTVQTRNAFFAQNQQINQHDSSKDLDTLSEAESEKSENIS